MTNDLIIKYENNNIEFDLEQYNQIYIYDYYLFFKFMMKLKEYEGIKFDEYHNEKLRGELFLFNQKCTKKDLLVVDLNDFGKIISNLTFQKGSLLRDIYLYMLDEQISIKKIDEFTEYVEELFVINDKLELDYKSPEISKILELMFIPHFKEEENYLKNPGLIVDVIIKYINITNKRCVLIIDSSIKAFDFKKLVDDERVIVIDTSIDLNNESNNIIVFNEDIIETIKVHELLEKVHYNFPFEITIDQLKVLMKTYLRIILNDELNLYDNPTDNLLTLYIVVRSVLKLELNKVELKRISLIKKENNYLKETLKMI